MLYVEYAFGGARSNMSYLIDDVAKTLASPMPRRQALSFLFKTLGGAALAAVFAGKVFGACDGSLHCPCSTGNVCGSGLTCKTCTHGGNSCVTTATNETCCTGGNNGNGGGFISGGCGSVCCTPGQCCCASVNTCSNSTGTVCTSHSGCVIVN
jgi:hypothetical protein